MRSIEVFDPAMCCPTGVCGPDVDPEVLRIAGVLGALAQTGFSVTRHGLSSDPKAFVDNAEVARLMREEGVACLPITFVDGELLSKGAYPSNPTLEDALGIVFVDAPQQMRRCCDATDAQCCCGGVQGSGESPCCDAAAGNSLHRDGSAESVSTDGR